MICCLDVDLCSNFFVWLSCVVCRYCIGFILWNCRNVLCSVCLGMLVVWMILVSCSGCV